LAWGCDYSLNVGCDTRGRARAWTGRGNRALDGGSSWGLANIGRDELELSKNWANEVMERTAAHIQLDARSHFAKMNSEMAVRWTAILFNTLMWGIAKTFTEGEGGITLIDGRFLFPETYDLAAMDNKLVQACKDPQVLAFLKSELRAALDPSNDFATELVHYVATGYVLYSYLGHRDHHDAECGWVLSMMKSSSWILRSSYNCFPIRTLEEPP